MIKRKIAMTIIDVAEFAIVDGVAKVSTKSYIMEGARNEKAVKRFIKSIYKGSDIPHEITGYSVSETEYQMSLSTFAEYGTPIEKVMEDEV